MRHGSLGLGTLWDRHYIHVREAVNPTMAMVFGVNHYQGWLGEVEVVPVYRSRKQDLTRLPSKVTRSRGQVDTEAIGLPNVQQMFHLCIIIIIYFIYSPSNPGLVPRSRVITNRQTFKRHKDAFKRNK